MEEYYIWQQFLILKACVSAVFLYCGHKPKYIAGIKPKFGRRIRIEQKVFAIPLEEKMKVYHNECHHGYVPFEDNMLDPDYQS